MCLAQGHKAVMLMKLEPAAPLYPLKHSTTEALHSPVNANSNNKHNLLHVFAFWPLLILQNSQAFFLISIPRL